MPINSVISTRAQVYQEEYRENEKESVICIFHVFGHSVNCKAKFLLIVICCQVKLLHGPPKHPCGPPNCYILSVDPLEYFMDPS